MSSIDLFSPIKVGALSLPNRIAMAPLTRCRADANRAPTDLNATYYRQRASAGLIIAEATIVTPSGAGYGGTPGIYSAEQIAGWKKVTDAVHDEGGQIVLQLWHCGRASHSLWQPNGEKPVSASAIAAQGQLATPEGMKPYEEPRALEISEIQALVQTFRQAAENAKTAGFDAVEVHGANGYLLDQFIRTGTNKRTDAYGGSALNRARFLLEVTEAVIDVWGADRVGVRLSPSNTVHDMSDDNPVETFSTVISELDQREIAYLHLIETSFADLRHGGSLIPTSQFRPLFNGALMVNGSYDFAKATAVLQKGDADLVSFGVLFLANPDLPRRFAKKAELNKPDRRTFYGGDEKGYTDYPTLTAS